jgi:hypothetical protein
MLPAAAGEVIERQCAKCGSGGLVSTRDAVRTQLDGRLANLLRRRLDAIVLDRSLEREET